MVGAPSFSELNLCIQPSLQCSLNICSSTSVNFQLPILPLFIQKIIHTIPTNTPHTSTIFQLPLFLLPYKHPNSLHQKYFPYLSHLAASRDQGARESCED